MPLTLLTGPAGSGKTGEVLERLAASLEREPVLVVPTRADVERYEDELLARRPVALGGRIVTFDRLFALVASTAGVASPKTLTSAQRRALVAAVIRDADLEVLAEPARRRGFPAALDRFIGECQAALVPASQLAARLDSRPGRISPRQRHLRELDQLYAAYVGRRDALGRSDSRSLAEAAVAALDDRPTAWGGRPVLVHGFDDLTPAQLALVEALTRSAEVLVSVVHEPARACLVARRRLLDRLEPLLGHPAGASGESGEQLPLAVEDGSAAGGRIDLPPAAGTTLLAHIERSFLTDAPERRDAQGELRLLAAAGVRNEVEQVGAEIVRLLRAGTAPDQIAVITRFPESYAALVEEVFGRFGIPAAVHSERRLPETSTGSGLISLLRAALTTRTAADLVAFLRCPGGAFHGHVDRLERAVRTEGIESVDDALACWERLGGRRLWELRELRDGSSRSPPLERLAAIARRLAEQPHARRAPALDAVERADAVAAEMVASGLAEIAELAAEDAALAPGGEELVALLEDTRVPAPRGSVAGHVEVMDPYRARARQFPYVFVISLQEGEFPSRRRDDPFLTDPERAAAGLPETADQRDEERYLFYVCLTRATRRLHLSFRFSDDEGKAVARSFLVDEVLDLLAPGSEQEMTESKGLSATIFNSASAPTELELARSLAERRLTDVPEALGASPTLTARLGPRLERARQRADRLPGPLHVPYVVEQFAAKRRIGASSLETNAECSFRYFVDHELDLRELAPPPEPIARGGMTHRVLERLYEERHGERPTPATLDSVVERARAILAEEAEGSSLDPRRPAARPAYRRMQSDIERFLRYDSEQGEGRVLRAEASFGGREDDEKPPLQLGGFELHGKIDRIDLVEPGRALIRDYKTGSTVATRKKMEEELKLQLPLYMLAVRELWGLEPVGGVYHPLGKQHGAVPRGLLRGPRDEFPLDEHFTSTDYTRDGEEFELALATARREAERLAARIHAGHLARDPLGGSCPEHCDFHPICRRERGEKNPEEQAARFEENGDE